MKKEYFVLIFILLVMFLMNFFKKKDTRQKLSVHFDWNEFDCKDGTLVPKEYETNVKNVAKNLEIIREHLGNKPIIINSGYRTPTHNRKIGGVPNSYHLKGMASDIRVKGVTPIELYNLISNLMNEGKITKGGLGLYKTFVHYDIQGKIKYWSKL